MRPLASYSCLFACLLQQACEYASYEVNVLALCRRRIPIPQSQCGEQLWMWEILWSVMSASSTLRGWSLLLSLSPAAGSSDGYQEELQAFVWSK
jgi:hypothetical protein